MQSKKKMCQTEDEKKRRGRFFRPLVFFVLSKSQNPQRERARWSCILKHRFISLLSALLRFSFFSLGVFIRRTSRWSRARVYIYLDEFLERRDEKKREKERKRRARETTIPEEKGKRKKKDRIVFSERSFA